MVDSLTESSGNTPYPLVVLGASAGGLEALQQFFKKMPEDPGIAFLVIQHMDPESTSELDKILARTTNMEVKVAENGMEIQPGYVYINPPNGKVTFDDNTFQIEKILKSSHRDHLTIDYCLGSMAENMGKMAICIILSGTGTDGTLGLKNIKEAGGMVMVQDPNQANFDGMPSSAIETGLVDFILPVEKMPEEIINYIKHPFLKPKPDGSPTHPNLPAHLKKIYERIKTVTGHDFSDYKQGTIIRRIERRMAVHQIEGIDRYIRFAEQNEEETWALFKDLLISVTHFFRDPKAFTALQKKVLTRIINEKKDNTPFRFWVAGCATGEEAYSLAILMNETLTKEQKQMDVQIFATDLDEDAISIARKGKYPGNIVANVSQEILNKYFVNVDGYYQIKKYYREMVVFAPHNLIKDPPFSNLDLICCRNLLIYLNPALQKKVLALIYHGLKPNGYLFLGTSENIDALSFCFDTIEPKFKIFQRLENVATQPPTIPDLTSGNIPQWVSKPNEKNRENEPVVTKLTRQIILNDYSLPGVLINKNNQIIYFNGNTKPFLTQPSGEASFDIFKMIRTNLNYTLKGLIKSVREKQRSLTKEGLKINDNNNTIIIDLIVRPVKSKSEGKGCILILFKEKYTQKIVHENREEPDLRIQDLEEELNSTKNELKTTIEDLQLSNEELVSANEELQAKNEELQSTNEELETSKEEIKSSNEELTTLNHELKEKIKELSEALDNIHNLLANTNIATLFLDKEYKIKLYTPKIREIFNLIETDIGRSIRDININFDYNGIIDDCSHVLKTLEPVERELYHLKGFWYKISINPYRTTKNIIDGLVITFFEISEKKALERLATVVEDSNDAITVQDLKGNIVHWNKGAEAIYGYTGEEALKMNIAEIIPQSKQKEALELRKKVKQGQEISPIKTQRLSKNGQTLNILLKMTKITNEQGNVVELATTEKDITEIEQKEKQYQNKINKLQKQLEGAKKSSGS